MAQDLANELVADLYRRERTGLARSVARITGESHAEDLVHDAFVAYLTKSPWAARPGAWVATVARNRALNTLRRPRMVPLAGIEPAGDTETPDSEREAVRRAVASALEALPERSLRALKMKFFDGADYPHIAAALGTSVPQAHVVVHRALRRLGRELVRQMAEAHGASECAPALARMAGLGGEDESHEHGPCPLCRPAWDEIAALRIGSWIPAPLLAFRARVRDAFDWLAGRIAVRGPLAADGASRAATALVAMGVAATTLAPPAVAFPSAPRRTTVTVADPAAGAAAEAAPVVAAPASSDSKRSGRIGASDRPDTVNAGPVRVAPPQDEEPGQVSQDGVGGTLVCTDINNPCGPPPPGRAHSE